MDSELCVPSSPGGTTRRRYDGRLQPYRPMTPAQTPASSDAGASSALGAFLRGVERRGLVFARLLAGSDAAGDEALAWALERFRVEAGRTAFGDWPRSSGLAARRADPAPATADPAGVPLRMAGAHRDGPRAALLLRWWRAWPIRCASVLGVAPPTYAWACNAPCRTRTTVPPTWRLAGAGTRRAGPAAWPARARAGRGARRRGQGSRSRRRRCRHGDARCPRRAHRAWWWRSHLAALVASFIAADHLPEGLDERRAHPSEPLPEAEPPPALWRGRGDGLHPDLALLLDAAERDLRGSGRRDPASMPGWWAKPKQKPNPEPELDPRRPQPTRPDRPAAPAAVRADRPAARRERLAALGPEARTRLKRQRALWEALPIRAAPAASVRCLGGAAARRTPAAAPAAARHATAARTSRPPARASTPSTRACAAWLLGPTSRRLPAPASPDCPGARGRPRRAARCDPGLEARPATISPCSPPAAAAVARGARIELLPRRLHTRALAAAGRAGRRRRPAGRPAHDATRPPPLRFRGGCARRRSCRALVAGHLSTGLIGFATASSPATTHRHAGRGLGGHAMFCCR